MTKHNAVQTRREIQYEVVAAYKGVPDTRDKLLRKAVGRSSDGSGYFLLTGIRDMYWEYVRKSAAEKALQRIRSAKIRGVQSRLYD